MLATLGLVPLHAAAAAPNASRFTQDPYPGTYQRIASGPVLIQGATVLTGAGERLDNSDVLLQDGKLAAIGSALQAPAGTTRVDGRGKWVTPGPAQQFRPAGRDP